MTIGERIKKRREELGLSQQALAEKIGYTSRSAINKIEDGTNNLRQTKIVEIAKALDTTPAYLMGWEEKLEQADTNLAARIMLDPEAARIAQKILELPPELRGHIEALIDSTLESIKRSSRS